jgi:hypothetical protein
MHLLIHIFLLVLAMLVSGTNEIDDGYSSRDGDVDFSNRIREFGRQALSLTAKYKRTIVSYGSGSSKYCADSETYVGHHFHGGVHGS